MQVNVGYVFQNLGFTEAILIDSCNQYQIFLKHTKCMINKNRFNTLYDLLDPYENTSSNYSSVCDPKIFTGILQKLCSPQILVIDLLGFDEDEDIRRERVGSATSKED